MANSCISRFVTEVAPPQVVSVMRRRVSKILDTIAEEEREVGEAKQSKPSSSKALPTSCFRREVARSFSIYGQGLSCTK